MASNSGERPCLRSRKTSSEQERTSRRCEALASILINSGGAGFSGGKTCSFIVGGMLCSYERDIIWSVTVRYDIRRMIERWYLVVLYGHTWLMERYVLFFVLHYAAKEISVLRFCLFRRALAYNFSVWTSLRNLQRSSELHAGGEGMEFLQYYSCLDCV